MTIISIIMFIFAACLLLYALIVFLSKKIPFLPEGPYSLKDKPKRYFVQFSKLLSFLSLSFIISGIIGLFEKLLIISLIVFVVLFVLLLVVGIKWIMKGYTD